MFYQRKKGKFTKNQNWVYQFKLIWFMFLTLTLVTTFTYTSILALFSVNPHSWSICLVKPQKAVTEQSVSLEEYVFNRVEEELGFQEAVKAVNIITCESNWRTDICIIEPNDTISCGLWQINTVHNNPSSDNYISNADKLDYKKATEWAIQKRKADGGWFAWSCYK